MVRILSAGDDMHRLEDLDGNDIGWISPRSIGFRGFVSVIQATEAAAAAWHALETVLGREYTGRPQVALASTRLGTQKVHEDEWITDGKTRIARLHRPHNVEHDRNSFAIEFELPTYASEGAAVAAANFMARTLVSRTAIPRRIDNHPDTCSTGWG